MTLFHYPASIETALAVAEKGIIQCPYYYELGRLLRMARPEDAGDFSAYERYRRIYHKPGDTIEELASRVASARHPLDIRARTRKNVSEEHWLKSVRLYGDLADALQHVRSPPSGVILGLEMKQPKQRVLLIPGFLPIVDRLKDVRMRTAADKATLIRNAFKHYTPSFYRIPKKA
jgi:hypothetical protein